MPRNPEYEYVTVKKGGKPTEDPKLITKVIVKLKEQKSSAATRLGDEYIKLQQQEEELKKDMAEKREKIRTNVEALFDAEDAIYARVFETAKLTMQISNATKRNQFNADGFFEELAKLVPELTEKVTELRKAFTTESPVASYVKITPKESIFDLPKKAVGSIKDIVNRVVESIKNWTFGYDKKLKQIEKSLYQALAPIESFTNYVNYKTLLD